MKRIFYSICYWLGIIHLFYLKNRKKQIVINYHHVIPFNEKENNLIFGYSHSVENFEYQMSLINKKFVITTEFGKANTVVVTFDDGAKNNYIFTSPILKRLKAKAYYFVVLNQVNSTEMLWTDKWYLWFSKVPFGVYKILNIEIAINNDRDRLAGHLGLWDFLNKNYHLKDSLFVAMDDSYSFKNFEEYVKNKKNRFRYMNKNEIEEMKNDGHLIGHHSLKHDILKLIPVVKLEEQLEEVKQSAIYNTSAFAIPFGTPDEYNDETIRVLLKQEFSPILVNYEISSNDLVGRVNLPDTRNKYEIHAYLSGFYYFIKKII